MSESQYLTGENGDIELQIRELLKQRAATVNRRDRQILKLRIGELLDSLVTSEPDFEDFQLQTSHFDSPDSVPLFDGEIGMIEAQIRSAVSCVDENKNSFSVDSAKSEINSLVELLKSPLLHNNPGCFSEASRVWGMIRCQNLNAIRAVDSLLVRTLVDQQTGHSVVHRAALVANVALVTLLVQEKGCDINCVSLTGQTPLHLAVDLENSTVVKTLLGLGANVSIPDFSGKLAFDEAPQYLSDLSDNGEEQVWNDELDITDLYLGDELLGEGATAKVFSGRYRNIPVAIKQFNSPCVSRDFLREIKILKSLSHPNILHFCAASLVHHLLVTELCSGSLYELIHEMSDELFFVEKIVQFASETLSAIEYLHGQLPQILHLDIKSKNLLLGIPDGSVRLADFGIARLDYGNSVYSEPSSLAPGTWWWMSPEALFGETDQIGPKSDMYAFGICLFELLCRTLPFQALAGLPPVTVALKVSAGFRPEIQLAQTQTLSHHSVLGKLVMLMEQCWASEPADRPTASEAQTVLLNIFDL